MEKANTVKIVEVCKISPSSQSSKFSLSLAAFDWLYLRSPQIERIFFYPLSDTHSFSHFILPKLKHSLSLTLHHFLPLAGNLLWPEDAPLPFILYAPNDAVSFTVAETDPDSDFDLARQLEEYPLSLVPKIQSSANVVPIMAVQVTKFPNNGFSIGFAAHRVVFDGKSSNIFIKSWAHICKMEMGGRGNQMDFCCLPPELTPSFERGSNVLQNPFDFVPKNRTLKLISPSSTPPSNWLRATFQLTPTNIQKLENRVLEWVEKTSSEKFYLSKFVVVYSYVLTCLIKAKQGECGGQIHMSFHADARWLLDPPVSSNYIGNCVTYPAMIVEAREFGEEDGFPNIAKKISSLIVELRRTRVIDVPKPSSSSCSPLWGSGVEVCYNVDSPKSKFYETDFGWGKPRKIDVVLHECNTFSLLDTRDGSGGVEVGLLLPTHQMDIFASLFSKCLN